jgi:hypothetical protein
MPLLITNLSPPAGLIPLVSGASLVFLALLSELAARAGGTGVTVRAIRVSSGVPQSAKSGREIHFYALRARTPESLLVKQNDVSAVLADQSPV